MTWTHVDDALPPLELPVAVCGMYVGLDENGRPTDRFPVARRRQYHRMKWGWFSREWRGEVGIEWWHELPDDLLRRYSA